MILQSVWGRALLVICLLGMGGGAFGQDTLPASINGSAESGNEGKDFVIGVGGETVIEDYVEYTLEPKDTLTVEAGKQLTVKGEATLNITSDLNHTAALVVDANGKLVNDGVVNNGGKLEFAAGSTYDGGTDGKLCNTNTIIVNTAMQGDSLEKIADAFEGRNVGIIQVDGDLRASQGLDFSGNTGGGTFNFEDTKVTDSGHTVNLGKATLNVKGADSAFAGDVIAGKIVVTATAGGTSFNKNVIGDLSIRANASLGSSGVHSGGDMDIYAGVSFANEGTINIGGTNKLVVGGTLVNTGGNIYFADGAIYAGNGSLNNAGGFIAIHTGMSASSMDRLAAALGTGDAGTIRVDGALAGSGGLNFAAVGSGVFNFEDAKTTTAGDALNLGGATLNVKGAGSRFDGDVAAGRIVIAAGAGNTVFNRNATGDFETNAATTFDSLASFSGGDFVANAAVTNAGSIVIGADKTLSGAADVTVVGGGRLALQATANYAGTGRIVNTGGFLEYDSGLHLVALFSRTQMSAGELTLTGNADLSGKNLALNSGSGGVLKTGSVTRLGGVDVKGAKLEATTAGTEFAGTVRSSNNDPDAILTAAATTFKGAVQGNLTADAATTLVGSGAQFSAGHLAVNAPLTNAGGGIAMTSGKKLSLADDLINTGTLRFGQGAIFAATGTASVENNANGRITADVGMGGLADLTGRTKLNTATSVFTFTTGVSTTLSDNLAFKNVAAGAKINFASANTNTLLTLNSDFDFANADVTVNQGAVAIANGKILTARTFDLYIGSLVNGPHLRYLDTSGSATIRAGTSNIRGVLDVAHAGGRMNFDGNLNLMNGTQLKLAADNAGIGKIGTLNLGTVDIRSGVTVAISGTKEDVINKALIIADGGAGNAVAGWQHLNEEGASRYEFALDADNNVYATKLRDTGNTIGNGNGGNTGNTIGDGNDGGNGNGNNGSGGNDGDTGSVNKNNGADYVDDLYDRGDNGLDIAAGDYIDETLRHGARDRYNAFGQMIGEYANASWEGMALTNDLFFKAVYNQMGLNQNYFDSGMSFGGVAAAPAHASGAAYGNIDEDYSYSADYYAGGIARRDGRCFTFRENVGKIWGGFLGGLSKQNERSRIPGYKVKTGGVILGYDRQRDRLVYGIAGSYMKGDNKVSDLHTKFDSDYVNLGLYGAFHHEDGLYAKAGLGYGHGWNDYDVNMIVGGIKKGSYKNDTFSANAELGMVVCLGGIVNLNPSVGARYMHLRQDGWTEKLRGGGVNIANWFGKERQNSLEVPFALKVNRVFDLGGVQVAPEVRAGWIISARRERSSITTGFVGSSQGMIMYGVDPGRNRFQLGLGVKARFNSRFDAGLDYNFEVKRSYRHHSLSAMVGLTF